MNKIDYLTAEQEALIPIYKKKWQNIAFSTKEIDREKVTAAIKQVYGLIDKSEPIIIFSLYPNSEEEILLSHGLNSFGLNFNYYFRELIRNQIYDLAIKRLDSFLLTNIEAYRLKITSIRELLVDTLKLAREDNLEIANSIQRYLPKYKNDCDLVNYGIFVDFCSNILDADLDSNIWQLFLTIVNNCSQIAIYENICFVYDRPILSLALSNFNRLHSANGKPILILRDGLEIYAFDGEIIPKKYGRVPVESWKPEWLLEENNIKLKELLIRQIPEERIRSKFKPAEELNQAGILTIEQEESLIEYQSQWQTIAFSVDKNNEILAKEYIDRAYQYLNLEKPQILFFDSPYVMQNYAIKHETQDITDFFEENIFMSSQTVISDRNLENNCINRTLLDNINKNRLHCNSKGYWIQGNYDYLADSIKYYIEKISGKNIEYIYPKKYITDASLVDFILSELNYSYKQELLEIFIGLVKHCGWMYPYKDICLVSRSPVELHLNNKLELHAIAKPAIAFADGFIAYAYQGELIPEQYGKLHPDDWNSQWIFEEEDVYVKYALIKGIGYDRISQELPAEIIASDKERGLLRLPIHDYFEFEAQDYDRAASPMQIFKMPHPQTKEILTVRIPSDINTIEDAIAWVNKSFDF